MRGGPHRGLQVIGQKQGQYGIAGRDWPDPPAQGVLLQPRNRAPHSRPEPLLQHLHVRPDAQFGDSEDRRGRQGLRLTRGAQRSKRDAGAAGLIAEREYEKEREEYRPGGAGRDWVEPRGYQSRGEAGGEWKPAVPGARHRKRLRHGVGTGGVSPQSGSSRLPLRQHRHDRFRALPRRRLHPARQGGKDRAAPRSRQRHRIAPVLARPPRGGSLQDHGAGFAGGGPAWRKRVPHRGQGGCGPRRRGCGAAGA
mmetsp:Transcript_12021/g.26763  ORF Transcript_12021/g.26763 Transcript_12021/m.26763 type:complete len:252 (-) Transcript_12021:1224-1979(-)